MPTIMPLEYIGHSISLHYEKSVSRGVQLIRQRILEKSDFCSNSFLHLKNVLALNLNLDVTGFQMYIVIYWDAQ